MNTLSWILLGDLALVTLIAIALGVYNRRRTKQLINALNALADNIKSGEAKRLRLLQHDLKDLCQAPADVAEKISLQMAKEEKDFIKSLTQMLLTDISGLMRVHDTLHSLLDSRTQKIAEAYQHAPAAPVQPVLQSIPQSMVEKPVEEHFMPEAEPPKQMSQEEIDAQNWAELIGLTADELEDDGSSKEESQEDIEMGVWDELEGFADPPSSSKP